MSMKYFTLSNGVKIPQLGLGTYSGAGNEVIKDVWEKAIACAIKEGYRLFDTAQLYHNEEILGEAIRKSGLPREEFFVVTKLWITSYENPEPEIEECLRKLDLGYIDLVLLHWPYGNYYHAWKVLEKYYKEGKIKAIGVSNFSAGRVIDLLKNSEIPPMVNQIEGSVYTQRKNEKIWHDKYGIVTMAYAPLGHGNHPEILEEEIIRNIAKKHGKTPAQVCIRYILDRGMVVIPKSSHENRIIENFDVFDFKLDEDDFKEIDKLEKPIPIIGRSEDPYVVERMYSK